MNTWRQSHADAACELALDAIRHTVAARVPTQHETAGQAASAVRQILAIKGFLPRHAHAAACAATMGLAHDAHAAFCWHLAVALALARPD